MKLKSIAFRGLTRFTAADPVTIDFDAAGGPLIALVGPNGAGKTTALEAAFAALHKFLPSRPGSLYDHCSGRDAFIEATFSDGAHELKARLLIDAEARKCEGYLTLDGEPISDGKAASFDAEVLSRFGSPALLLSSVFAAQTKAGNFLTLAKRDRKALFVELLGLARLQVLHESAKIHGAWEGNALDVLRREIAAAEEHLKAIPAAEASLSDAQVTADVATTDVDTAREAEADASRELGLARSAADRIAPLEAARAAAKRELAASEKALAEAEGLPRKAETARDEKIRFLDARKAEDLEPKARRRHADTVAGIEKRRAALAEIIASTPAVKSAAEEIDRLASERAEIDARAKERAALEAKVREAKLRLDAAEKALAAAVKARDVRIADLRRRAGLLPSVPCKGEGWLRWSSDDPDAEESERTSGGTIEVPWKPKDLAGTCPLLADARQAREDLAALEAAPTAAAETTERDRLAAAHDAATAEIQAITFDAATDTGRLRLIEALERELKPIAAKASAIAQAHDQMTGLDAEVAAAGDVLAKDLDEAARAVDEVTREREVALHDFTLASGDAILKIAAAKETATTAKTRHVEADSTLTEARAQLGDAGVTAADIALSKATATRKAAEATLREADQFVAAARAKLDQLRDREASLAPTRAKAAAAETELGDWTLLADALGRDGIQALEIDAAGPEVARITNELLESCYGPRFSVSFETLREKKSAAGEYVEAFDVAVYDSGAVRPVESLSGGEKVIVGEAVSLAIAIFNSRKNEIRWETLFRDETAGALDPANAERYVSMLRRAAALGGFSQVIFVAHLPEVWQSADVQVHVDGGRVSVGAERRAA